MLVALAVLCLNVSAYSQDISLKTNNVTVKEAMERIEKETGYLFVFSSTDVNTNEQVSVSASDAAIEEVVKQILKGQQGIDYEIQGKKIILRKADTVSSQENKKKRVVSGKVVDVSGVPIIGATILEKGTSNGTVTDFDGKFNLNVVDGALLDISYIGFKNQQMKVIPGKEIYITLKEDSELLDEVVVVGYGIQKKSDVTGAVISLKSDKIQETPTTTLTQALQGKLPGVQITQTASSAEGNDNTIRVRGRNSISADSSPLVILDGIPYSGYLSEIAPSDVESMEILKDASSAAIYGARAANGVILITTKKGKEGKVSVSYNGYYGIDKMYGIPDIMNASEFYNFKKERLGSEMLTVAENEEYQKGTDTDWIGLATRLGQKNQHNISVSGGTQSTKYFLSASLGKNKGVAKNDNFDRYTIRMNLDSKITSWLSVGVSTQLGYYGRSGEKANIENAFKMNPLNVPYNEDGSINFEPWKGDTSIKNPLENMNYVKEDVSRSVVSSNYIKIDFPFIKGLSYRMNAGYSYRYRLKETYKGRDTMVGNQQGGASDVQNQGKEDWTLENIINYSRTFGKHSLDITGLYSAQQYTEKFHNISATGFPGDYMSYYQSKYGTTCSPSDTYTRTSSISQMLRINYNYHSKYLLTLTARRDGFSAFGADTKFGIFPSAAIGWNIEQEDFMSDIDWLDRLKLRLSYGVNGNQAISAYSSLPTMSNENYLDDNKETMIGFYPNKLADPTLSWESTKSFNFGFDFSFLKGRLLGAVDVFFSKTHDLLLNKVIPQINGVNSIRQNIGKTSNKGVDLQLTSVNIKNKNFSWTTDFNISHSRNKILDIGIYDENGKPKDNIGNKWFIGEPIGVVYSYVFDGIWQENDDIKNSHMPEAKPGDIKIKDVSGPDGVPDGKITPDDKQIVGKDSPNFIAGISNTFAYKNISLSFYISGVQGITKSTSYMKTYFSGRDNVVKHEWWTPENPINTFPANREDSNPYNLMIFGKPNDASYVRLNDVTLSYNFPVVICNKIGLKTIQLYFNAKNLVTLTNYVGLDPEISSDFDVPPTRSFIFGLRFNL